jgi:hypothetical protein
VFLIVVLTHNGPLLVRDLLEDFSDWIGKANIKTKVKRERDRLPVYHEDDNTDSDEE